MTHLTISLLGTVQVKRAGQPVTAGVYAKALGLLAYLAVEADHPHSRATLAALLWPEQPGDRARHSLRQALSVVRQAVGDGPESGHQYLETTRDSIQFNRASDTTLDVREMIDLFDTCQSHRHQHLETCSACAQRLEHAMALYRGDFLAGLSVDDSTEFEDWAQIWRQRLRQRIIDAAAALTAWHEHCGALDLACLAIQRQLELDPWREEAHRRLMDLQWQRGRRSDALAQYERCRKVLEADLGTAPESATTALFEAIRSTDAERRPTLVHPRPALRLPEPVSRMIGRQRELEELFDLITQYDCRLLTLTGPGGSGKTRLAQQVAIQQARQPEGSVCFVELATITTSAGLAAAIASGLGLTLNGQEKTEPQLLAWMRDRSIFLILDNAEQLTGEISLLARMLATTDSVTILVTSRERLHLQGEWVYEVEGLGVPTGDDSDSFEGYGSVELFGERLRQVRPKIPMLHEERPAVIHICRLVGGLPLAIELAAAWAQSLTLPQIETEIRRNLDFLATTLRDIPDRHRSMRAVFNHTWDMLDSEEQEAYRRLSVFRNSFRLEAAEAVADSSPLQIAALVGKSLVMRLPNGRYCLHELLRHFGEELVQRDDDVYFRLQERHAAWYLTHLADQEEALTSHHQQAALDEIERDIDNIRLAWTWAVSTGRAWLIDAALHSLWLFHVIRGWMREGSEAFGSVLDTMFPDRDPAGRETLEIRVLARSLTRYGGFLSGLGHYDQGIALLAEGLALLRELDTPRDLGLSLNMLAAAHHMKGEINVSQRLLEEGLDAFRQDGDAWGIAHSLNDLGLMSHLLHEQRLATQSCEESRTMFARIGDRRGSAFVAFNLGMIAASDGDHHRARRLYGESLALRQGSHDQWGMATSLVQLGWESRELEFPDEARSLFLEALRIAWNSSVQPAVLDALLGIATLLQDTGAADEAQAMLAAIAAHPSRSGQLQRRIVDLVGTSSRGSVPADPVIASKWAVQAIDEMARGLVD